MENPVKSSGNGPIFRFGPFRIDAVERSLFKDDQPVVLPGKAFDLLLLLVESAGHLKSRGELIEALWPTTIVVENSLSWHISVVRKALGDEERNAPYIETLRGHGYRFVAPVQVEPAAARLPAITEPETAPPLPPPRPARKRAALLAIASTVAIIAAAVLLWHFGFSGGADSSPPGHAVAVLPFENLSADRANAYFAAGIQDTILSKLAGIGELRVISRTSTEQYPSHPVNLRQIAAQLGVHTVLEGSVQKSGTQVLINVQLIDARSNDHIWAQTYTRSLTDVFAVENDVATQVAAALQAKLLPAEAARLASAPTHDPQAYLLFLKANYYAYQITSSNNAENPAAAFAEAVTLYRQAVARDPNFALAWARLSYLQSYAYWRTIAPNFRNVSEAEQAANRALALDPALPQARLAMGYVDYYGHRDYAAALAQFQRVRQTLPNDADALSAIAFISRRLGKWDRALSGLHRAAGVDPRNPRWPYETGIVLMQLRRYGDAGQQFDRALALEPNDYDAAIFKALALLLSGKPIRTVQRLLIDIPYSGNDKGLTTALRFELGYLARRPDDALAAIKDAPSWVSASNAVGEVPVDLLRAKALTLNRDAAQARQAYGKARAALWKASVERPADSSIWALLGLVEAGLGEKEEAIKDGQKAVSLTPISKDALYGPSYLVTLAKIYAATGEPRRALSLLQRLLAIPAGEFLSPTLLRLDPDWDSLRDIPAFQALLMDQTATSKSP